MSSPPHAQAHPKEKFDVLYATFIQLHEGLVQFEVSNGAFLFLFFGWLLSAAPAQQLIQTNLYVRLLIIAALLVLTGFHSLWVLRHYVRSVAVHKLLLELNYVPASYLEPRRIHKGLATSFIMAHALMSLMICFVAWAM